MDNELPKYNLEGVDFIVDVEKNELREVERPENRILFSNMCYTEDGYTFNFDPFVRNIPHWTRVGNPEIKLVKIPHMGKLDPSAMARRYDTTLQHIEGKSDLDIMVDSVDLSLRMAGFLPQIMIEKQLYEVDSELERLVKKGWGGIGIPFSEIEYFQMQVGDGKYRFVYDTISHDVINLDMHTVIEIPENAVMVEIPDAKHLDPVGYAKSKGSEINEVLREVPYRSYHITRIIPWKDTGIYQAIEANLKRLNPTNELNADGKRTVNKGRKKGPGL